MRIREYANKKFDGSLVDVTNRVAWSKQFTNSDTVGYNVLNVLSWWDPCSVRTDFCTSPATEIVVNVMSRGKVLFMIKIPNLFM